MNDHQIKITEKPYFSAPLIYLATCSCGRYQSGKHVRQVDAEKAASDHVKAKKEQQ